MVVQFTRVVAYDCFAYKHLDFTFENGIHSVTGMNGASKTSLFLTLIQGLFNKNPKGTKIEDVNNEITGEPYEIQIFFTKGASEWQVINSKKSGKIEIFETVGGKTYKRHLARIPDNLKLIEEILETDYPTFVDLVYQSPKSSLNLLESSSDGERKKFISRVNRLDELDAEFDRIKEREKALAGKHGTIAALQKQVEAMEQGVIQPQPELEELPVEELEASLKVLWGEIDLLKAQQLGLERDKRDLEELLKKAEANQGILSQIESVSKELGEFQLPEMTKEDAQERAKQLQEELRSTESLLTQAQGVLSRYEKALPQIQRLQPLKDELASLEEPECEQGFAEENLRKIEALLTQKQTQRVQNQKELKSLEDSSQKGACPTCGHSVDPEQFRSQIEDLQNQIAEDSALIGKCEASVTKYQGILKAHQILAQKRQELERLEANPDTKIDGNQAKLDVLALEDRKRRIQENLSEAVAAGMEHLQHEDLLKKLELLKAQAGEELDSEGINLKLFSVVQSLNEVLQKVEANRLKVSQLDGELTRSKDHNSLARARKQLNLEIEENNRDLKLRLDSTRKEVADAERLLEDLRVWLGILGPKGYRVRKIDRFLRSFNLLIRKYSEMITSGRIQCVFYLDEDGEVQFTVTDSHKTIKWANWSEGEKARVKMSCLFATLEILEATGSSSFNVLCLDEIFGSLDADGKEGLFRVLDHLKEQGRCVYVIAHSELTLPMTYTSIVQAIKHEDGTSSIQQ